MTNGSPVPPRQTIIMPEDEPGIPSPPIHPLSALATIMLDAVWGVGDFTGFLIPLLSLITGGLCFLAVFSVQKFIARDGVGASFAKALLMAILAGVPFMVMGTAAGVVLLGWAGLSSLSRLGSGKS